MTKTMTRGCWWRIGKGSVVLALAQPRATLTLRFLLRFAQSHVGTPLYEVVIAPTDQINYNVDNNIYYPCDFKYIPPTPWFYKLDFSFLVWAKANQCYFLKRLFHFPNFSYGTIWFYLEIKGLVYLSLKSDGKWQCTFSRNIYKNRKIQNSSFESSFISQWMSI